MRPFLPTLALALAVSTVALVVEVPGATPARASIAPPAPTSRRAVLEAPRVAAPAVSPRANPVPAPSRAEAASPLDRYERLRERIAASTVEEARRLLVELIATTDDPVELRLAADGLGAGGDLAIAWRLASIARDARSNRLRLEAALAALEIGEREPLPEDLAGRLVAQLEAVVEDEAVAERAPAVVRALASPEAGREGVRALVRLVAVGHEELALRAARLLHQRGEPCARAALERLAREAGSRDVRDLATLALE